MSRPKSVKAPPLPPPQAIPETAEESSDETMKRIQRASGFKKTILTGKLTPNTGKKTVLGY